MADAPRRLRMLAQIADLPAPPPTVASRAVLATDGRALGLLAFAAYHGTIDDHGESKEEHVKELTASVRGRYGRLLLPASRVVAQANGRLVAAARRQPRRRPLPAARVRRGVGAPILTNDQLDYPPPYGRPNCSTACRNAGGSRSESSRSAARPLGGPKARAEASRIRQVIRPEKNAERHTPPEGVIDGVLRLGGVERARSWALQAAASMTT
jgi:hypothetical protein